MMYCAGFARWRSSVLILLLCLAALPARPIAAAGSAPALLLLTASAEGLTLRWESPSLERIVLGESSAAGWATAAEAGGPALPIATALVVLPPTGAVTLTVNVLSETTHYLPHALAP